MDHKVILQKLATKYGLSIQKVEEAVYYQFKYTACIIKDGLRISEVAVSW